MKSNKIFTDRELLQGVTNVTKKKLVNNFSYGKYKSDLANWAISRPPPILSTMCASTCGRRGGVRKRMTKSLSKEPFVLKDKKDLMKGYLGTPLPLLPDISKAEITIGQANPALEEFGIVSKEDGEVRLYPGPNKKLNRYLNVQYSRMIKVIGGEIKYPP